MFIQDDLKQEGGFTLVEIMITMVVSFVILAGLFSNFTSQNKEYRYQNDRIDVVQDMEFVLKFIAEDLRSALITKDLYTDATATPVVTIDNYGAAGDPYTMTTGLRFTVWDASASGVGADKRADRVYTYNGVSLKYERNGGVPTEILEDVSFFKVFDDSQTTGEHTRATFGIPLGLPSRTLNYNGNSVDVPGYTIIIQAKVGSSSKMVTRYIQVHPQTLVE